MFRIQQFVWNSVINWPTLILFLVAQFRALFANKYKVYEMKFLCQMLSKVIACCVLAEIENVTIKYTEVAKSESVLNVKWLQVGTRAWNEVPHESRRRPFSWWKVPTSAFTFKTLLLLREDAVFANLRLTFVWKFSLDPDLANYPSSPIPWNIFINYVKLSELSPAPASRATSWAQLPTSPEFPPSSFPREWECSIAPALPILPFSVTVLK